MPIRTFIAVDVPDVIRDGIARLQSDMKRYRADVKWVRPESIHITLKFLGDVQVDRIDGMAQAIKESVEGVDSFPVSVGGTGMFPGARRPRVFWVGVKEGAGVLSDLALRIETALNKLGFEKEKRKYSAHLTIGRVRTPKGIQPVVEAMRSTTFEAGVFEVDEIVLMKSDLKPTGAVYTALRTVKLRG